jgi:hypothetical protein
MGADWPNNDNNFVWNQRRLYWANLPNMQRTQIYTAPWQEKWRHFACPFAALTNLIQKIWKMCQIPEDVRILAFFSDLQNSTSKCSKLTCKVNKHFPTSISQILTAPGQGSWFNLHAILKCLKVEYCGFQKRARFLRISGVWHFFQILNFLQIGMQSESTFLARHLHTDPHSSRPEKDNSHCMPIWST